MTKYLRSPLGQIYVEIAPDLIVRLNGSFSREGLERLVGKMQEIDDPSIYFRPVYSTNSSRIEMKNE